jgi:hypothetical protein
MFYMSEDAVNSPDHYNHGGLETIDAIREALGEEGFFNFCRGSALKYIWRAGHKHDRAEDLAKAAWYCRMAAGDDPRETKGTVRPLTPAERKQAWIADDERLARV